MFNQCISTTCSFRTLQEVTGVIRDDVECKEGICEESID